MITPSHVDHGVQTVVYHTLYGENRALGLPSDVALAIHALRCAIDERDEAAGGGAAPGPRGRRGRPASPSDAELVARLEARALRRCLARGVLRSTASFAGGADEPSARHRQPRGGRAVQTGAFRCAVRDPLRPSAALSWPPRGSEGPARARARLASIAHVPCLTRALASSPRAVVQEALARPLTKVVLAGEWHLRGQPRGRGRRGVGHDEHGRELVQAGARHAAIARAAWFTASANVPKAAAPVKAPQGRARLRRRRGAAACPRRGARRDGRAPCCGRSMRRTRLSLTTRPAERGASASEAAAATGGAADGAAGGGTATARPDGAADGSTTDSATNGAADGGTSARPPVRARPNRRARGGGAASTTRPRARKSTRTSSRSTRASAAGTRRATSARASTTART